MELKPRKLKSGVPGYRCRCAPSLGHQIAAALSCWTLSVPQECPIAEAVNRKYLSILRYILLCKGLCILCCHHINTMVQRGFRGCAPLELFNHGNTPIELVVGSRICQVRIFRTETARTYLGQNSTRKYYGDVRPVVSRADCDEELSVLSGIASSSC